MSETFICTHCQRKSLRNKRLKLPQSYCGLKECQQARKNHWERERQKEDANYKTRRKAAKRKWYNQRPGDRYQAAYRQAHPDYCEANRVSQQKRNRKARGSSEKIVKTDALLSKNLIAEGLYVLLPYDQTYAQTDAKKIVKTDALIVQMIASSSITSDFFSQNSRIVKTDAIDREKAPGYL